MKSSALFGTLLQGQKRKRHIHHCLMGFITNRDDDTRKSITWVGEGRPQRRRDITSNR